MTNQLGFACWMFGKNIQGIFFQIVVFHGDLPYSRKQRITLNRSKTTRGLRSPSLSFGVHSFEIRMFHVGIFTYIHHKFKPNVDKYSIHGAYMGYTRRKNEQQRLWVQRNFPCSAPVLLNRELFETTLTTTTSKGSSHVQRRVAGSQLLSSLIRWKIHDLFLGVFNLYVQLRMMRL